MRAVLLICFLLGIVTLTGCMDQVKVTKAKEKNLLLKAQKAIHLERDKLIGSNWYAGRHAEKFGFNRTEKSLLKSIKLSEFTCMKRQEGTWYSLDRAIDCHSYVNFIFKSGTKNLVFKTLLKFKNVQKKFDIADDILADRLSFGFVKQNPYSKKTFARYWKVLREGRLAVGMPEDYLKICWGKPLRVFNKSIDATGKRETYVYDRYFVRLENGIVQSIHKFDS